MQLAALAVVLVLSLWERLSGSVTAFHLRLLLTLFFYSPYPRRL